MHGNGTVLVFTLEDYMMIHSLSNGLKVTILQFTRTLFFLKPIEHPLELSVALCEYFCVLEKFEKGGSNETLLLKVKV